MSINMQPYQTHEAFREAAGARQNFPDVDYHSAGISGYLTSRQPNPHELEKESRLPMQLWVLPRHPCKYIKYNRPSFSSSGFGLQLTYELRYFELRLESLSSVALTKYMLDV